VRFADMYRLPLPDGGFDTVVLQMVLHHAEAPAEALAEAARVLRPGGRLLVIDLAPHQNAECLHRLAHRWPGFADAAMRRLLEEAELTPAPPVVVAGPLEVRIWSALHAPAAVAPVIARAQ
jgi:ArsR family transcriptional regulator